jgi:hypothetical protein
MVILYRSENHISHPPPPIFQVLFLFTLPRNVTFSSSHQYSSIADPVGFGPDQDSNLKNRLDKDQYIKLKTSKNLYITYRYLKTYLENEGFFKIKLFKTDFCKQLPYRIGYDLLSKLDLLRKFRIRTQQEGPNSIRSGSTAQPHTLDYR